MAVLSAVLPKGHILVKPISRLHVAILTKCEMLALFSPLFFFFFFKSASPSVSYYKFPNSVIGIKLYYSLIPPYPVI